MECMTLDHVLPNGQKIYKAKKAYDNQDTAIAAAKALNLCPKQITKAVAYHCHECKKYHVGRNGKPITPKYIDQIKRNTY